MTGGHKTASFSVLLGMFIAAALICIFEFALRMNGMEPHNNDTKELWAAQRVKASALGKKAVILVGSSRIQLGIDLDNLGKKLGLQPVQLAIDGAECQPVLEDLANDPDIEGTILVALTTGRWKGKTKLNKADEWLSFYHAEYKGLFFPTMERLIKTKMQNVSNIYSSGVPLKDLLLVAVGKRKPPTSYLITNESRERNADYNLVPQPYFYLARAIRHLGIHVDLKGEVSFSQAVQKIRAKIPKLTHRPATADDYTYINALTRRLQLKGAQVVYIRFPTSGLVWEIDEANKPKDKFWDQFAKYSIAPTIHFKDYPVLDFNLADGSHLDQKQKHEFTENIAEIIKRKLKVR